MRRADRLFRIIQILRSAGGVTAAELAKVLEVSPRTIYRDIQTLIASGVPIEGEAGMGYARLRGFDLPPLMFTGEEIEALVLGARMVETWGDPDLVKAAREALSKIETVLPDRLKARVGNSALFSVPFDFDRERDERLALLRSSIRERRKVRFSYTRGDKGKSTRTVRPLCLAFMAPTWTLCAWCELRKDFRTFRLDRMRSFRVLDKTFEDEPQKSLEAFLRLVAAQYKNEGK